MKDDILSAVVEVEKELAVNLANEKKKAAELLEKLRDVSEKEILREEKSLQYRLNKVEDEARTNAEAKASKMLDEASANADMLAAMSDDSLRMIIRKHIVRIRP